MIDKVGIAFYHSNLAQYPKRWIDKCISSVLGGMRDPYIDYNYYELSYGAEAERVLLFNPERYRHEHLPNYAAAMNEIYGRIFADGCDVAANVNIDDYYHRWRIGTLLETLKAGADIASSNYILVDENDAEIRRTDFAGLDVAAELARDNNIVSNPCHVM